MGAKNSVAGAPLPYHAPLATRVGWKGSHPILRVHAGDDVIVARFNARDVKVYAVVPDSKGTISISNAHPIATFDRASSAAVLTMLCIWTHTQFKSGKKSVFICANFVPPPAGNRMATAIWDAREVIQGFLTIAYAVKSVEHMVDVELPEVACVLS